jgi:hypothetical protein
VEGATNIEENVMASNLAKAIAEAFQTQATIMLAGIPFSLTRIILGRQGTHHS